MRHCKRICTACGALALLATPALAHPASTVHVHSDGLVPLLASVAVLAAVLLLRSRSRVD